MARRIQIMWADHLIRTSARLRRKAAKIERRSRECIRLAERHYERLGVNRFAS